MSRSFVGIREELTEEHRQVMSLVDQIRNHRALTGLGPLLEDLHTVLIRHFSHEQFPGGLYDCMGAYGSRHHQEIKLLIEDHCRILSSVRGLLERTRIPAAVDETALLEDLDQVMEHLLDHEKRENALADKLSSNPIP